MTHRIWDFIRSTGRIWKTALAAGVAWQCAVWTGTHRPYFAPLAAILSMQVTVEESIGVGYQRILGIAGGIVLADLTARFVGIHAWSIALLVLISTAGGTMLRLGAKAVPQVGISSMMVLTLGMGSKGYGADRIGETVIGVFIAILVNMYIVPPDYTLEARKALSKSAAGLADRFRLIAEWFRHGADMDAAADLQSTIHEYLETVHSTFDEINRAIQALHYSPLVRKRRQKLMGLRGACVHLRQGYAHAAGMLRTCMAWRASKDWPPSSSLEVWASRFNVAATLVDSWREALLDDGSTSDSQTSRHHSEVERTGDERLRSEVYDFQSAWHLDFAEQSQHDLSSSVVFVAALVNDSTQLLEDFSHLYDRVQW